MVSRFCLWGGRRGSTQLKLAPRAVTIPVRYTPTSAEPTKRIARAISRTLPPR